MNGSSPINTLILGRLSRETTINCRQEVYIDQPGGNLLYTAYGFRIWNRPPAGLISRVGRNFPAEWISGIQDIGFDTRGILTSPEEIESRRFFYVNEGQTWIENPQKFFNDHSMPFPKELLGYTAEQTRLDNRKNGSPFSIKPEQIPLEYLDARYLMVCPVDFLTHNLIPPFFRSKTGGEVFFHPSRSYLHASFYHDIPPLVRGATALIASESNLLELFLGKSEDIWEIAETIANFGVDLVVVTRKSDGYLLYNCRDLKRLAVPAYPAQLVDPIGVDSAFCGGFLAGYTTHFDPLLAVQMGSVSASIKLEGSTAEYLLGTLPELAHARLEVICERTRSC